MPAGPHHGAAKRRKQLPEGCLPGSKTHAALSSAPPWAEACLSTRASASQPLSVCCQRLSPPRKMLLRSFRIPLILCVVIFFQCTGELFQRRPNTPLPPGGCVNSDQNHHFAVQDV